MRPVIGNFTAPLLEFSGALVWVPGAALIGSGPTRAWVAFVERVATRPNRLFAFDHHLTMSRVLAELARSETPVKAEHSRSPRQTPGLDVKPNIRGQKRLSDMTLDELDDRDAKRPNKGESSPEPETSNLPPELLAHINSTCKPISCSITPQIPSKRPKRVQSNRLPAS